MSIANKRRLQLKLKKLKYDLVVDLKNTIFPLLLGPKYRTGTIQRFPKSLIHKREHHLCRLAPFGIKNIAEPYYIYIPKEDDDYAASLLKDIDTSHPVVVISPGAKSHLKRWRGEAFAELAEALVRECASNIIFIGSGEDKEIVARIRSKMKGKSLDLVDKTNLRQLAALLKRANLLVTNDSAPMHLGCAVGTKVLALFGPTDPKKYGPIGEFDIVINKKLFCSPCETAVCKSNYECMTLITAEEVLGAAKMMIEGYE
jgi:lipopolysaccharide heptosyltransferase II